MFARRWTVGEERCSLRPPSTSCPPSATSSVSPIRPISVPRVPSVSSPNASRARRVLILNPRDSTPPPRMPKPHIQRSPRGCDRISHPRPLRRKPAVKSAISGGPPTGPVRPSTCTNCTNGVIKTFVVSTPECGRSPESFFRTPRVWSWWRCAATWYHESIPGHHLQIATALLASDRQSRFHRLVGNTSGYAEGWALYAERLMDELG